MSLANLACPARLPGPEPSAPAGKLLPPGAKLVPVPLGATVKLFRQEWALTAACCAGANVIPVSIFHSKRVEALPALIQSALDIHANMLRLWGGAAPAREPFIAVPAEPYIQPWHACA